MRLSPLSWSSAEFGSMASLLSAILVPSSQVQPTDILVGQQLAGGSIETDMAILQHVTTVDVGKGSFRVLLDHQHGGTRRTDGSDGREHFIDHHQRQPGWG